jgi:hypothetical protein
VNSIVYSLKNAKGELQENVPIDDRTILFVRQSCQEVGAGDWLYAVRVIAMRLIEGILAVARHEDEWNVVLSQYIGDRI